MCWNDETFCSGGSRYTANTDLTCLISTLLNVVLKLEIALEKNIVFLTAQQCSGGITHFFSLIQKERFKWQAQPQAPQGWNKKHFQMVGIKSVKPSLSCLKLPGAFWRGKERPVGLIGDSRKNQSGLNKACSIDDYFLNVLPNLRPWNHLRVYVDGCWMESSLYISSGLQKHDNRARQLISN